MCDVGQGILMGEGGEWKGVSNYLLKKIKERLMIVVTSDEDPYNQLDADRILDLPREKNGFVSRSEKIPVKFFSHNNFNSSKNDLLCFDWRHYLCALNRSAISIYKNMTFWWFSSVFMWVSDDLGWFFATRIRIIDTDPDPWSPNDTDSHHWLGLIFLSSYD